jgi:dienelactone hydrolase
MTNQLRGPGETAAMPEAGNNGGHQAFEARSQPQLEAIRKGDLPAVWGEQVQRSQEGTPTAMARPDYLAACVAGLETFIFGAERKLDAPVVFVTHGRGGNAADTFAWCRELAGAGLIAVGVEQRNHGRRMVDREGNSDNPADMMYGIILGTARDISLLIDCLPARLGIATDRVGVTGGSLGGHVTQLAMALEPRISVGASLIGSGDFRHLMELRATRYGIGGEGFPTFYRPALDELVRRYDPIEHPERLSDRPLLMLNGDSDDLVQMECNQRLEAAVRPYYSHPERLRLIIYPGVGHAVPPEMWAEAKQWLVRWLLETPV